jgi:pimeloyl-[acyl-carrier protein] methyl ester esterase
MISFVEKVGRGNPLVFIHGFGFNKSIWSGVVKEMKRTHTCYLVDLPGFGYSEFNPCTLAHLLSELIGLLPSSFALCGWSLGGVVGLAMSLLAKTPVTHFISVTSDPGFNDPLKGLNQDEMERFYQRLREDKEKALKGFVYMLSGMTGFDKNTYQLLLKKLNPNPSFEALSWGMDLLLAQKSFDALSSLSVPSYFLLGEKDRLVRPCIKDEIDEIGNPFIQTEILEGAGHLPFISHEKLFVTLLRKSL